MKTKILLILFALSISIAGTSQNVYTISSGEMIFSQSQTTFTPEFLAQYPDAMISADNVRFTMFFHLGQYVHYDFNNSFGIFSGLALRNIGMITDEKLPQTVSTNGSAVNYQDYKIIRREYTVGVPLALKLGAFNKHFYFFGGGEYELSLCFKEKFWSGGFDRSGSKTKNTKWFSNQSPTFIPSVFAGVQFPHGLNLKFKYYLNNFLNSNYKLSSNDQNGNVYNISDLRRYEDSQVMYFTLSWQFDPAEIISEKIR